MNRLLLPTALCAGALSLMSVLPIQAASTALDAVAGASLNVSKVTVSATSAALVFTEKYTNGTLRCYTSTETFAAADTSKATIAKFTVTTRGSGTITVSGLKSGTTYYYRLQGWYPKGMSTYFMTGSFTTSTVAVERKSFAAGAPAVGRKDALGRPRSEAAGVAVDHGIRTLRTNP